VFADTTRRDGDGGTGCSVPSASTVARTSRGWTHRPPFAIVAYTVAIWIGVAEIPCPYAIVDRLAVPHS